MASAVPRGIQEVADRARHEREKSAAPVAEAAVQRAEKNAPRKGIADHVENVAVKRETRDRTPRLPVENERARRLAANEPGRAEGRRSGDGEKKHESEHDRRRDEGARMGESLA